MRNLAPLVAVFAVSFLFARGAVSQDAPADVLKLLREKALERESAFDNVEATLSYTGTGLKGPEPPRPLKAHWIRSGNRRLLETEIPGDKALPSDGTRYSKTAVETSKSRTYLFEDVAGAVGGGVRADIYEARSRPTLLDEPFCPETLGVTAIPIIGGEGESNLGTLARFLDPRTPACEAEYAAYTRDLHFTGKETVNGRELLVVEEKLTRALDTRGDPQGNGPKWQHTVRLYFDPSMDYACVMMDTWRMYGDYLGSKSSVVFSDFREVKPGLFVPMSCVEKWQQNEWLGQPSRQWTNTYKIESLDFRSGFDDALFDLEFPPGTRVTDHVLLTGYTMGGPKAEDVADMIPEPPDSDVALPKDAAKAGTGSEIEAGTTGAAAPAEAPQSKPAGPRIPVAVWILAAALVFVVAAVVLRSLRKKPPTGGR